MGWQTVGRLWAAFGAAILLSGCLTPNFEDAQPEKYAAYDCAQLDMLSESYRAQPQDLLLEEDPSELERTNSRRNISILGHERAGDRKLTAQQDRDRRSIALARRQKDCL